MPGCPLCSILEIHAKQKNVMSEDMVKDGYVDIMNIDISSVVVEMMRKKYAHVPQLKYMQMDVRDMNFFQDESFDCVIDKGTLDSLMCGTDAPLSVSQMLEEVNRLLRPGGIYMLITYGDPSVRIPHLNQAGCNWKIVLYIIPRPGFESRVGCSSAKSIMEPVPLTERGLLPAGFVLEDPDSHYIYVCKKMHGSFGGAPQIPNQVGATIAQ
ncbi:EEF1A lysine methyltransferase 4 isoform X4 [Phoenix dactylifera]|uniref:EEF1A lysine methyltransferase 4 isoform X4 n=1 Tax=Phoenix dactylifera TaxID=42345 RepID=A0A8B8J1Z1_PHODC|nr:EEF1A lysine methyltransferase 4 isoform X4 [Phoenix dactylifera]